MTVVHGIALAGGPGRSEADAGDNAYLASISTEPHPPISFAPVCLGISPVRGDSSLVVSGIDN
jgi:hypothetical protein